MLLETTIYLAVLGKSFADTRRGAIDAKGRREWIAALDLIASLSPTFVIAGHKAPGTNDNPRSVQETKPISKTLNGSRRPVAMHVISTTACWICILSASIQDRSGLRRSSPSLPLNDRGGS